VVSHRPSALAALNMAMVLHQGNVIAFGPREEAFAQVARAAVRQGPFGSTKPGPALVAGGARP
jgi:ABC-type protease/lipase transport system fused ATPase/permease subunit